METKLTIKDAPVDTYQLGQDEEHEVKRLDQGVCNMLGPVVVGGRIGADCFCGEIQAGQPDPPYEFSIPDATGDSSPRRLPW